MGDETTARAHAWASGRVQGVFFRESTRVEAERLGVTGWVANLPDGRVEIVAEGPREQLEALIRWARRGPPDARIDALEVAWEEATGEWDSFQVRWRG
jgi:acylphosphatase